MTEQQTKEVFSSSEYQIHITTHEIERCIDLARKGKAKKDDFKIVFQLVKYLEEIAG